MGFINLREIAFHMNRYIIITCMQPYILKSYIRKEFNNCSFQNTKARGRTLVSLENMKKITKDLGVALWPYTKLVSTFMSCIQKGNENLKDLRKLKVRKPFRWRNSHDIVTLWRQVLISQKCNLFGSIITRDWLRSAFCALYTYPSLTLLCVRMNFHGMNLCAVNVCEIHFLWVNGKEEPQWTNNIENANYSYSEIIPYAHFVRNF